MAPKGGGRGGGGGSSGSSSGSSGSSCDLDYPCNTEMGFLYGHRYTTLYSNSDIYGQLSVYAIWSLALILLLLLSRKSKARLHQVTIGLFLASFIFLCVRYGLMIENNNVAIGYRFESSIVVMLQRLGMVFLFIVVNLEMQPGTLSKIIFWPALGLYAVLNVAYLILDFIVSKEALDAYKDVGDWHLSDRDFGLTYTPRQILELKTSALPPSGLSPFYIESRVFDSSSTGYLHDRGVQVKIGVAADFLALALAVFIASTTGFSWIRGKNSFKTTVMLQLAATGLLLTTFFRVVVATHFVLRNWAVVTDQDRWDAFIAKYPDQDNVLAPIDPPDGFLEGYRTTVNGFPVVQAVLEPLGVVLAIAVVVNLARTRRKENGPMHTGTTKA